MNTCYLIELPLPQRVYTPNADKTLEIIRDLIFHNPGEYLLPLEGSETMVRYLDGDLLFQAAFSHALEEDIANDETLFGIVFDQVYNKSFVSLQKSARRLFQSDCLHYQNHLCRGCQYVSSCLCD